MVQVKISPKMATLNTWCRVAHRIAKLKGLAVQSSPTTKAKICLYSGGCHGTYLANHSREIEHVCVCNAGSLCLHRTCSSWDFSGPEENMAMDRKRNDNTASRVSFPPHCYICVRWVSSSYTCRLCPSSNILGRQKKGGPNWTKACRTFSFSLGELWRTKSLTACTRPQRKDN